MTHPTHFPDPRRILAIIDAARQTDSLHALAHGLEMAGVPRDLAHVIAAGCEAGRADCQDRIDAQDYEWAQRCETEFGASVSVPDDLRGEGLALTDTRDAAWSDALDTLGYTNVKRPEGLDGTVPPRADTDTARVESLEAERDAALSAADKARADRDVWRETAGVTGRERDAAHDKIAAIVARLDHLYAHPDEPAPDWNVWRAEILAGAPDHARIPAPVTPPAPTRALRRTRCKVCGALYLPATGHVCP